MATGKEIRSALRSARKLGCHVERLPNSHWKLTKGTRTLWVPFSPGSGTRVKIVLKQINKFAHYKEGK